MVRHAVGDGLIQIPTVLNLQDYRGTKGKEGGGVTNTIKRNEYFRDKKREKGIPRGSREVGLQYSSP